MRSVYRPAFGEGSGTGYRPFAHGTFPLMIGLSVAVGRFVEALFWAIFRVAGVVAVAVLLAVVALLAVWLLYRRARHR